MKLSMGFVFAIRRYLKRIRQISTSQLVQNDKFVVQFEVLAKKQERNRFQF